MTNIRLLNKLLSEADVKINGQRPWDIQLYDENAIKRIFIDGSLGFGETYMDGLWDCDQLDELINRLTSHDIERKLDVKKRLLLGASIGQEKILNIFNRQSVSQSKKDIPYHYDLGNDLFKVMLDESMTYTCGYWKNSNNLTQAQEAKLDLVCQKIGLKPGMRILDIGCGWGSFMNYAAEHYGVICDGLTLSKEQMELGREKSTTKQLPVNFILEDYRLYSPDITYDRVVSIGMIEHVGPDNYQEYFECISRFLKDDGIFLLHTIGQPTSQHKTDAWINKYIFPNGVVPSMTQLGGAMEQAFNIEDLHNIGPDYYRTLMAWYENFEKNWPKISKKYDEKFYRMWKFYLLSCAGSFKSRNLNVWQIVSTKIGTKQPESIRAF